MASDSPVTADLITIILRILDARLELYDHYGVKICNSFELNICNIIKRYNRQMMCAM